MLMPKRVKYRKQIRGRMTGKATRGAEMAFGEYGLQALRVMRRRGKMWIRIFPDKPYTQKPPETRMGKGKGNVEYWVSVVKPGRIMFEIGGLPATIALEALHQASYKFSIRTKVVARHDVPAGEQAGEQE